ncbi:putative F-box-like domain superfamily protein [Helianthus debilis subsp. tardiflorus]
MTTTTTLPSNIIHTHILPRLDGPSLSATATVSSHLHHLCSDDSLWADVTKSTWPSSTHPRAVADIHPAQGGRAHPRKKKISGIIRRKFRPHLLKFFVRTP